MQPFKHSFRIKHYPNEGNYFALLIAYEEVVECRKYCLVELREEGSTGTEIIYHLPDIILNKGHALALFIKDGKNRYIKFNSNFTLHLHYMGLSAYQKSMDLRLEQLYK